MNFRAVLMLLASGWLILLLQSTIVSYITYGLPQPELLLVALAHCAIYRRSQESLLISLLYGYQMDLFSGRPFGSYLLTYVLLMLLARGMSARMLVQARWVQILFVAVLGVMGELILMATTLLSPNALEDLPSGRSMAIRAGITALSALFIFPPLDWLERRFWSQRRSLL